ncbi:MAG: asparaginase [Comamonas sp.]
MSSHRKIAILGTGGTIAGQGASAEGSTGYQAGQLAVAQLLQPIQPMLDARHALAQVQQVLQMDSKDMDVPGWQQLAAACVHALEDPDITALVITHGTDTLEETAWFLQCVLPASKPVVLTCAMRPADALSADGPANLRDAVAAALELPAGVWVVAAGEVHSAAMVRKVHPYRLHAFASYPQGALASVEEGRVQPPLSALSVPHQRWDTSCAWQTPAEQWPWVEVVLCHAGARAAQVEALVQAGVQGLVVACTGNGSIHKALLPALQQARAQGVVVWKTTRCEQGSIVLAPGEDDAHVSPLSPVKARISLMLQLLAACT